MRRVRRAAWACAFALAACGSPPLDAPPGAASSAASLPSAVPPVQQPFTGRGAADRLRARMVRWTLDENVPSFRSRDFLIALELLPAGHAAELALLEGIEPSLLRPPPPEGKARDMIAPSLGLAERWIARGDAGRSRALVTQVADIYDEANREQRRDVLGLTTRLDGRAAAISLAERIHAEPEERIGIVRAEALHGDFRWATAEIAGTSDLDACLAWNALVVRHVRDGRADEAREAWVHARKAVERSERIDFRKVDCFVDFGRTAAAVGALDEASRAFAQVEDGALWPACRILDALADSYDPRRLDVLVALVAVRRDGPEPPLPTCYDAAAFVAGRSGDVALARSLRRRSEALRMPFGAVMIQGVRAYPAEVAARSVDPLDPLPPGRSFEPAWLPALVAHFEDVGADPVDAGRFDARFPASSAPWKD